MSRPHALLAGAALLAALVAGASARADVPRHAMPGVPFGLARAGAPQWVPPPPPRLVGLPPIDTPLPQHGFPAPPEPDDRWWSDEFGLPDPDGFVTSAVAYGNGFVIGGTFTHVGEATTPHLAMWDGLRWVALGGGVDGPVTSLAVYDGDLIASGPFEHAGTVAAHGIARWDGRAWAPLGNGLGESAIVASPGATALAVHGGRLVAGGRFTFADNLNTAAVAVWDGIAWTWLGSGLEGEADALLAGGGDTLYAGGHFERAGIATDVAIVMWDGHAWSVIGDGLANPEAPATVRALASFRGRLIAAGWLFGVGYASAPSVQTWDGTTWSPVEGAPMDGQVLLVDGDTLLVGGGSLHAWDGTSWGSPAEYTYGGVTTLAETPLGLVVGGAFLAQDGENIVAAGVGLLRDGAWQPLQHGSSRTHGLAFGGYVRVDALASFHGELVAGGSFAYAGSDTGRVPLWNFGRWDGHDWRRFPDIGGYAEQLLVDGGTLYAAGQLWTANTIGPTPVARFDGASWTGLDTLSLWPRALAHADGVTYVAGYNAPGRGVIWRSAGGPWRDIGEPYGARPPVIMALLARGGGVLAGGFFDSIGGVAARGLAFWDGTRWTAYGPAFRRGEVDALCECGGRLYAGGLMEDDRALHGVMGTADGHTWEGLDDPDVQMYVRELACVRGQLYAGGRVLSRGDHDEHGIARWTGSDWQVLGSGTGGTVGAIAGHDGDLYVGGNFTTAGGRSSSGIARWRLAEESLEQRLRYPIAGDPNPFTTSTSIAFTLAAPGHVRAFVHDLQGRRVATLLDAGVAATGVRSLRWDGRDDGGRMVPAGVYLVRIETPRGATLGRVVRLR